MSEMPSTASSPFPSGAFVRGAAGPKRWKLSLALALSAGCVGAGSFPLGVGLAFGGFMGNPGAPGWQWVLYYVMVAAVVVLGAAQMRFARSMLCAGLVMLAGVALLLPFFGAIVALPLIVVAVIVSGVACAASALRSRR